MCTCESLAECLACPRCLLMCVTVGVFGLMWPHARVRCCSVQLGSPRPGFRVSGGPCAVAHESSGAWGSHVIQSVLFFLLGNSFSISLLLC